MCILMEMSRDFCIDLRKRLIDLHKLCHLEQSLHWSSLMYRKKRKISDLFFLVRYNWSGWLDIIKKSTKNPFWHELEATVKHVAAHRAVETDVAERLPCMKEAFAPKAGDFKLDLSVLVIHR